MADIFISYSRSDLDRIRPIAEALAKRGWTLWWDPDVPTAEPFDRIIAEELQTAGAVVVIWSKNSIGSYRVKAQAAEGLSRQILIPVIIDPDIDPPVQFRILQSLIFVDVKNVELSAQFKELLSGLKKIIGPPPFELPPASDSSRNILEYYCLISFAIEDFDLLQEKFDYDALQFLIRSFGEHLNNFFCSGGGYTSRERINEYSVFFTNKDLDSFRTLLENFAASLKKTGIPKTTIRPIIDKSVSADTVIINIYAGLAIGKPHIERELVLEYARSGQKILAGFLFDKKTRQPDN
jgi:hypothetical protein